MKKTLMRLGRLLGLGVALIFLLACNLVNLARSTPEPGPPDIPTTPAHPDNTPDPSGWAKPVADLRWQWQLSELPVDLSLDVDLYDIDLFDNEASVVAALHRQGRKVICYLSAGSWEKWRPDADQFPAAVIGKDYAGWPGENWLDIRQIESLAPVMRARLDLCRAKGFDGIEPDNIDGYNNDTGFPLTYADQIQFNLWLADEAHARGLTIGLKNDPEQVQDLLAAYDWALTEDCFAEGWCESMLPFIQSGKPVFAAEYTDSGVSLEQVCPQARKLQFSLILKDRELNAERQACPASATPAATADHAAQIDQAEQKWNGQKLSSYRVEVLVVNSIWHAQSHQLVVEDDAVTASSATCSPAPAEGQTCALRAYTAETYTIPGLFAQARSEILAKDARWLKVAFDPTYGFPSQISYDDPNVLDEDWTWRVTKFEPLK